MEHIGAFMDEWKNKVAVLIRFCTVGVGNTLIDFSLFLLLIKWGFPYLTAQFIAYSAGIANSFIWNRFWTFRLKGGIKFAEVIKFLLINILALIVTNILLHYFYELLGWSIVISKGIATIGGILITYIGSKTFVFQQKKVGA